MPGDGDATTLDVVAKLPHMLKTCRPSQHANANRVAAQGESPVCHYGDRRGTL